MPTGRWWHLSCGWLVSIFGRHLSFLVGLLFVLGLPLGLEAWSPYFFGCDDNYHQFLPVILESIHQVEAGNFPGINSHQAMGMPVFATGTYSVSYPGIYLAYWLAILCGSQQYFMETYAFLHIVAGYGATYFLLRRLKIEQLVAVSTAASYVLGAYVIFIGKAWYYTFPTLLFLPLLVGATLDLVARPTTFGRVAWWGMVAGVYFHSGNAQLWAYTMFFCGLLFVMKVATSQCCVQKWLALFLAGTVAVVITSPVLIAQYQLIADVDRDGSSFASMKDCFLNYLVWSNEGYPAYTGSLLFGAGLLSLVWRKWNVWAVLGVVGILCSLGKPGGIWLIMADSPVFEKFQHPFKFVLFATFFMLIRGAEYVDWTRVLRLSAVLNLLLLSAFIWDRGVEERSNLPYAPLSQASDQLLGDDRIYSFASSRLVGEKYSQSMANNFASYYGKNVISSYSDGLTYLLDEQIRQREHIAANPLAALQAYGCRWILVHESFEIVQAEPEKYAFVFPEVHEQLPIYETLEPNWTERYREPHFVIYELPDVAPLAFPRGSTQPLPIDVCGSGMRVRLQGIRHDQNVIVVNFLMRPGYVATQGDKTLAIAPDQWGRIQVTLDNHKDDLLITYWPIHW
ncbi:hypothetical protein C5Y96_06050 [Blastopirellula marina]|uniref:Glycosyltransferase RgtA/B/C/D-like domain-containing protein n=1 Tax=Blastopirellula marina TaxID=124 RepID=A0A2S8FX46_9BACT|nr:MULTISPECIES: hypothetical protein [Pirellulaceae]PQO36733.1 hypothetical protein C5Y96_06050 [Blastopirellula marina]RCS53448.1 hypothetical protein DTL36_06060 [Bremerella cremea]